MQCYAIEMLPLQGLITACDELQLTAHYQHSENGRLIYSGATRYNPQPRNHRVIIGCRTFRDLLMWQTDASNFVFANKGIIDPCAACHVTAPPRCFVQSIPCRLWRGGQDQAPGDNYSYLSPIPKDLLGYLGEVRV